LHGKEVNYVKKVARLKNDKEQIYLLTQAKYMIIVIEFE